MQRTRNLILYITMTGAVPGCFFSQLKEQQEQCDREMSAMLTVPTDPPVADLSGRWACVYQGPDGTNNEALDIVQNGSRATVTMRDGYNNSAVSDGQVGGNVLAWRYEGGSAVRFQVDPSGRMLDGQVRAGAAGDCSPNRYTCTRH